MMYTNRLFSSDSLNISIAISQLSSEMFRKSITSVNLDIARLTIHHLTVVAIYLCFAFTSIALFSFLVDKLLQKTHYLWVFRIVFPALRQRSSTNTYQFFIKFFAAISTNESFAAFSKDSACFTS